MNQNRLAGFFGLTKKEFSISLAVGGLIVLAALIVAGYITFKTDRAAPTTASSSTLAVPPSQASTTATDAPLPGTAAPAARSLPTLVISEGRLVIAGGVIAGPATQGAFMQAAATARPITAPPAGQTGALASSLDATGTAKAAPSPTGTARPPSGLLTAAPSATPIPLGSVFNPVPLGTAFTLPGLGVLTVQSTSWQPDLTGLAIANVSFTCQLTAPQTCATSNLILAAVGSTGTSYARTYDPAVPQPTFGSFALPHLLAGQVDQGNAGFVITNPESTLKLRVRVFLQDGEYYFWLGKTP